MSPKLFGAVAALALLAAGAAGAATLHFAATLNGASETPPNTTAGTGQLSASLDTATRAFAYDVTYSGLTGPALAAHFHVGAPGSPGPVAVGVPSPVTSPIHGTATLTAAQVTDLEAGNWYFNIHTAANKGGEVRGQVVKAP